MPTPKGFNRNLLLTFESVSMSEYYDLLFENQNKQQCPLSQPHLLLVQCMLNLLFFYKKNNNGQRLKI